MATPPWEGTGPPPWISWLSDGRTGPGAPATVTVTGTPSPQTEKLVTESARSTSTPPPPVSIVTVTGADPSTSLFAKIASNDGTGATAFQFDGVAPIIGGVLGGVVLFTLISAFLLLRARRKRLNHNGMYQYSFCCVWSRILLTDYHFIEIVPALSEIALANPFTKIPITLGPAPRSEITPGIPVPEPSLARNQSSGEGLSPNSGNLPVPLSSTPVISSVKVEGDMPPEAPPPYSH
jgi:hypothetical protein